MTQIKEEDSIKKESKVLKQEINLENVTKVEHQNKKMKLPLSSTSSVSSGGPVKRNLNELDEEISLLEELNQYKTYNQQLYKTISLNKKEINKLQTELKEALDENKKLKLQIENYIEIKNQLVMDKKQMQEEASRK